MSAPVVERKQSSGSGSIVDEKSGAQDHALPVADFDVRCHPEPFSRLRGRALIFHFQDPNGGGDVAALEDDSPYPEVRSAVANTDDPDMPCNTFRAWVLGLFWGE
jgi:hypothetical protein